MKVRGLALILLSGIVLLACACEGDRGAEPTPTPKPTDTKEESAYWDDDNTLQNTIGIWRGRYPDEPIPAVNGTVTVDGEERYIVDFCYLYGGTYSGDMQSYKLVPESAISINGADNDNCDKYPKSPTLCHREYHYIWAMDEIGVVYSTCIGDDCWANNESGFQGVYP